MDWQLSNKQGDFMSHKIYLKTKNLAASSLLYFTGISFFLHQSGFTLDFEKNAYSVCGRFLLIGILSFIEKIKATCFYIGFYVFVTRYTYFLFIF